jgi:hypothetical protein
LGQTITNSTNRIFGFPSKELFNRPFAKNGYGFSRARCAAACDEGVNPKPETRNPKSSIPKPSILNPKRVAGRDEGGFFQRIYLPSTWEVDAREDASRPKQ